LTSKLEEAKAILAESKENLPADEPDAT